MDDEKHLAETFEQYQELAKQDKNVDVAALMVSALQKRDDNQIPPKSKRWAYLVSVLAPPFGLIYSIKYYFFDNRDDAKQVAFVTVILTVTTIVATILLIKGLLSTAGVTPQQIQQINPNDIIELYQ